MSLNWEQAIANIEAYPIEALMLAAQLISTLCMLGIVSFVHVVQYPMLALVPSPGREEFERRYCNRAGLIIAPLMIVEAFSALYFTIASAFKFSSISMFGLVLVALIWAITFGISVPAHQRLITSWDDAVHRRLLFSNLLRVILWMLRAGVALICLIAACSI